MSIEAISHERHFETRATGHANIVGTNIKSGFCLRAPGPTRCRTARATKRPWQLIVRMVELANPVGAPRAKSTHAQSASPLRSRLKRANARVQSNSRIGFAYESGLDQPEARCFFLAPRAPGFRLAHAM